jgi:hypothetical protein
LDFPEPQIPAKNEASDTSSTITISQIPSQQSASLPAQQSTSLPVAYQCYEFYKDPSLCVIVERPCFWINISIFGIIDWSDCWSYKWFIIHAEHQPDPRQNIVSFMNFNPKKTVYNCNETMISIS